MGDQPIDFLDNGANIFQQLGQDLGRRLVARPAIADHSRRGANTQGRTGAVLQDHRLADLADAKLGPIRDRLTGLLNDRAEVGRVLGRGAEKARALAAPTLRATQDAIGLQV